MQLAYVGVLLIPAIILGIVGIILIALAIFWPKPTKEMLKGVAPLERPLLEQAPVPRATTPEPELTGPVTLFSRSITWPTMIDRDAGELDVAERFRIIEGLRIVGDAWCAAILAKAFDEEEDQLRVAAIEALGRSEGEIVAPTLERAYASYAVTERYAAIEGASRRGDVELLERALRDTDGTVALAAAYGLHRANRDDIIERQLSTRNDARAEEIRRVLPILA